MATDDHCPGHRNARRAPRPAQRDEPLHRSQGRGLDVDRLSGTVTLRLIELCEQEKARWVAASTHVHGARTARRG